MASVGSYSGVAGTVIVPFLRGAQIWVKQANQAGGLNGHPIELLIFDDGTDPARHRALVQQAVEQRKAIALFANGEGFTGRSSLEYVNSKRIPVIGTELAESWGYESPMYFMQATAADALSYTALATAAQQVLPSGKKKLGSIACSEVQFCENGHKLVADHGPKLGFEVAYRARASIAQPDFTAECLAASRAGVQVMVVFMDGNSLGRIATACARQNLRPTYAIFSSLINDNQKSDPNLNGMVASSTVFPWFQKGTPATDQYQKAFSTFGAGLEPGAGPATGWTAGVLLGRAGARLSEPPTSQSLLEGLWALKNDDLGGLTQPLTFVKDQPAKPLACWFNLIIKDRAWTNPDNGKISCTSPFG